MEFIDIPGIVDAITHTVILNLMELFDLKGIFYNFAHKGLFLGLVPSLIT
jgi:hypothetical protein